MAEQYIFNIDAEEQFYKKLEDLHDKYVYHLLLSGVAPKKTDLETIKMTKSPVVNKEYCGRVVGGLTNLRPSIITRLTEDKNTKLECIFTKINDGEHLNHVYMIQNVMDWPQLGSFSCQVWYLGETSIRKIKEHWDE
jgi:hypothetical protein